MSSLNGDHPDYEKQCWFFGCERLALRLKFGTRRCRKHRNRYAHRPRKSKPVAK